MQNKFIKDKKIKRSNNEPPRSKKALKASENSVVSKTVKDKPDIDCPVRKKCGGCQMLNLPYERQLSTKMAQEISLLGKFCHVEEIHGMDEPYHYRNKVTSAFGWINGKGINGMYQSSSHKIVQNKECLLEDKRCGEIVKICSKIIKEQGITIYDPRTGKGTIRHILVRIGKTTKEIMVVPVTSTPIFPQAKRFCDALISKCPDVTTIVQAINDTKIFLWLGDKEKVLFGKGYIEDILCGKRFRISPKSFYQINPTQTEFLYSKAIELASIEKDTVLLDAYCGIGTIGIIAADKVKAVIGVESNPEAVKDAKINAKLNGTKNIKFYCEDAGELMNKIADSGEKIDCVITDPPRAGCSMQFLRSTVTLAPKRIVYVSCNPETLARDVAYLSKHGYKAKTVIPVDMFPHTEHIETVCLLSKLHADQHIEVELNLDEMDLTTAESKATYDEIKEYVLENTGLKVSQLYIAQIKRKYGIIERANYNLPKSENAKVPNCPPDKEAAIVDALKHFGMIK